MPTYMLLGYQPTEGGPDSGERLRWKAFDAGVRDAGAYLAHRRLARPEEATTLRVRDEETQIIDGPATDPAECLAGYYLIETSDLGTALKWAALMPCSTSGSVEVRPAAEPPADVPDRSGKDSR